MTQHKHGCANIKEPVLEAEAGRVQHSPTAAQVADVCIQIEGAEPRGFRETYTRLKFTLSDRIEECLSKVKGCMRSIVPVGGGSRMCNIDNLLKKSL